MVHVSPKMLDELDKVSEITLMDPQTILDDEGGRVLRELQDMKDDFYINTMECWLDAGLYPRGMRTKVRKHIADCARRLGLKR